MLHSGRSRPTERLVATPRTPRTAMASAAYDLALWASLRLSVAAEGANCIYPPHFLWTTCLRPLPETGSRSYATMCEFQGRCTAPRHSCPKAQFLRPRCSARNNRAGSSRDRQSDSDGRGHLCHGRSRDGISGSACHASHPFRARHVERTCAGRCSDAG